MHLKVFSRLETFHNLNLNQTRALEINESIQKQKKKGTKSTNMGEWRQDYVSVATKIKSSSFFPKNQLNDPNIPFFRLKKKILSILIIVHSHQLPLWRVTAVTNDIPYEIFPIIFNYNEERERGKYSLYVVHLYSCRQPFMT